MQRATSAIPIVFTVTFDPVAEGLASSLARPGGNITGITSLAPDLFLKQVELLMAFIPGLRRVGILWKPDNPAHAQFLKSLIESAAKIHVQIVPVPAASSEEIASGFAGVQRELVRALVVLAETFDDPVHAREDRRWNRQADSPGSLQIDHKLELCRLLDRKVARFCALENPVHEAGGAPVQITACMAKVLIEQHRASHERQPDWSR